MRTALIVILVPLIFGLAAALLGYVLRPVRKDDVMRQAVGDAPIGFLPGKPWSRGGTDHQFPHSPSCRQPSNSPMAKMASKGGGWVRDAMGGSGKGIDR
jgi:hypothetical protein